MGRSFYHFQPFLRFPTMGTSYRHCLREYKPAAKVRKLFYRDLDSLFERPYRLIYILALEYTDTHRTVVEVGNGVNVGRLVNVGFGVDVLVGKRVFVGTGVAITAANDPIWHAMITTATKMIELIFAIVGKGVLVLI